MIYKICTECGLEKKPNESPNHHSCAFRKLNFDRRLPKLSEDIKRIQYLVTMMKSMVDYKSEVRLYQPFAQVLNQAESDIIILIDQIQTSLIKKHAEKNTLKKSA